jgi:Fe2+ transport system protein FeoA
MGCMPGEEITLNYAAPFSGPMCFLVQGTLISMRKELAQLVPITDPNVK